MLMSGRPFSLARSGSVCSLAWLRYCRCAAGVATPQVDSAVSNHEPWQLALLGLVYLVVLLIQGGLKYILNLFKGRVLEEVARDLRKRILARKFLNSGPGNQSPVGALDSGTTLSMLMAESEDVGEFASASLSVNSGSE